MINADDNLSCIPYSKDENCYMSVPQNKDQENYLCGTCWWGYAWHYGKCVPMLKGL